MLDPHPADRLGLWLHGASGRMGQELRKACAAEASPRAQLHLVGGSSRTFDDFCGTGHVPAGLAVTVHSLAHTLRQVSWELLLDFSTPAANQTLYQALAQPLPLHGQAILLGTTGLTAAELDAWRTLAKDHHLRLLVAPNTSIGILLTAKAALLAALPLSRLGFDIEIVETHHRRKKDAPSGTAKFLADTIATGVGGLEVVTDRSGARLPGELGVHAVRGGGVFGEHEVRLIGEDEEVTISHRAFSRSLFAHGALVLGGWIVKQKPGVYGLLDVQLKDL